MKDLHDLLNIHCLWEKRFSTNGQFARHTHEMSYNLSTMDGSATKVVYGILVASLVVLVAFFAVRLSGAEDVEPGEPPVLYPRIPFIGHMIGLMTKHNNYFTMLRCVACPVLGCKANRDP